MIRASYDLLGYISFFTVGEDECRAWSIPRGTPAQLAAGEIHSDIARGFIRAEVVGYDALDRARLDGRVPRSRRGAARRQGIHRAGRRHHQLPLRHMIGDCRGSPVRARRSSFPRFNEGAVDRPLVADLRARRARGTRSSSSTTARPTTRATQAAAAGARVIRHPYNKGNGAAVKTGIRHATGDVRPDRRRRRPASAGRRRAAGRRTSTSYDLVVGARSTATQASGARRIGNALLNAHRELPHRAADSRSDVGLPRRAPRVPARVPAPAAERLLDADDDDAGVHRRPATACASSRSRPRSARGRVEDPARRRRRRSSS